MYLLCVWHLRSMYLQVTALHVDRASRNYLACACLYVTYCHALFCKRKIKAVCIETKRNDTTQHQFYTSIQHTNAAYYT